MTNTIMLISAGVEFSPAALGSLPRRRPPAFQAGRIPKSPCKVRVFACAADRWRLPLVAAVAVTVAVRGQAAVLYWCDG